MIQLQQLFEQLDFHIQNDNKPSDYLSSVLSNETFNRYPFTILSNLKAVYQSPVYHPEGSVWKHTLLVCDLAAKYKFYSNDQRVFMWSALLHDVGKAVTTKEKNGKITSYDHEIAGEKMAAEFLNAFSEDDSFIKKVTCLTRWHVQALHFSKKKSSVNLKNMLSQVNLKDIVLLSLCDRLGRSDMTKEKIKEEKEGLKLFVKSAKIKEQ